MDDFRRSSNIIPAFGDWDYADGLPITQYFESARQAGLIRYNVGDGTDLYGATAVVHNDLYQKPTIAVVPPRRKTKSSEKGAGYYEPCVKEQKKQASLYDQYYPDVKEPQTPSPPPSMGARGNARGAPKPVDEDLYSIPPEFLYSTTNPKKKKKFSFFSSCLMPCAA